MAHRSAQPSGIHRRSASLKEAVKLGLVSRLLDKWVVAPPVSEQPCSADLVAGASMIVRREVFEEDWITR